MPQSLKNPSLFAYDFVVGNIFILCSLLSPVLVCDSYCSCYIIQHSDPGIREQKFSHSCC